MSRFYILSEWCYRHDISITRYNYAFESEFIFSKNNSECKFDAYDVFYRPDVVKDKLKDIFRIRG